MRIGDFDTDERVLIVAEIGNNHEGDVGLAEEMIRLAADAGADAVKFQTFRTEDYVSARDRERFDRLKSFELSADQFNHLAGTARRSGLLFLSTPFDLRSVACLAPLVDAFKIASGDNTFYPLLERVADVGRPMIISTGLATQDEIERAKQTVEARWERGSVRQELALLHCVSAYPVPQDQANLAAIPTIRAAFECTVGYSDHTLGIEAAVLAVAVGARIVEKHFTIDRAYSEFRDHQLSADPAQLTALVHRVREVESMLGHGEIDVQPVESEARHTLRRSIVTRRALAPGDLIRGDDLTWVRPAGGLAPGEEALIVGRETCCAVEAGDRIALSMINSEMPV